MRGLIPGMQIQHRGSGGKPVRVHHGSERFNVGFSEGIEFQFKLLDPYAIFLYTRIPRRKRIFQAVVNNIPKLSIDQTVSIIENN
jgi:hypothetical protein